MASKSIIVFTLLVLGCVFADNVPEILKKETTFRGLALEKLVLGGEMPVFMSGNLGNADLSDLSQFIKGNLHDVYQLVGSEEFVEIRRETDIRGNTHVFYQQYNKGLEVDGGIVGVHVAHGTQQVFAVGGSVMPDTLSKTAQISEKDAIVAIKSVVSSFDVENGPELVFLIFNDQYYLAYRTLIYYQDKQIVRREYIFTDANTGDKIFVNSLIKDGLDRDVFSAESGYSLPGTKERTEGQSPVSDGGVNSAYDKSGICYNYYYTKFARDSYDDRGASLVSTVHYGKDYNNAFWNGVQMVYGDGDGKTFAAFEDDLTVVCHELTHAVTSYSADLRYEGESGALNEAMSDIFAAAVQNYYYGGIDENTWHIGWQCFLEGVALRFMNNPILDGISRDWYPTRYTGSSDNGGVHINSGIANLAFVLLTEGGVHPQQKSTNWVEGIGFSKTEQIFYSALTEYMTTNTGFATARAATEVAAKALYGPNEEQSVSSAWEAVGVASS